MTETETRARSASDGRTSKKEGSEGAAAKAAEPASTGGEAPHVCSVAFCPIGMALSTVQQARPDAVEHLLLAGREFLLAAKAVLDARAADVGRTKLEKIEIG